MLASGMFTERSRRHRAASIAAHCGASPGARTTPPTSPYCSSSKPRIRNRDFVHTDTAAGQSGSRPNFHWRPSSFESESNPTSADDRPKANCPGIDKMTETLRFPQEPVAHDVPELGLCYMRAPTFAVERILSPFYANTDSDPREFVDVLLSHTLIAPRLSYDDVHALADNVRSELRAAAARAARLPEEPAGALGPADSDKALLNAMRERFERFAEQLNESVDAARSLFIPTQSFLDALHDVRERIHAAARGRDVAEMVRGWIERLVELGEVAGLAVRFFETQPLGFVVIDMTAGEAFDLLMDAAEKGDHVMADAVEQALIQDDGFMDLVCGAIRDAATLDEAHKAELLAGVRSLAGQEPFAVSCRLLLGGIEGTIWLGAEREGVTDRDRSLVKTSAGRPKALHARNVNLLLDDRWGLDLSDDYRLFLDDQLFDGHGQDLRHGRANRGHREYAYWALIAVCGWLDRCEETELMHSVGEHLDGWAKTHA
jgi:hypothetical protein